MKKKPYTSRLLLQALLFVTMTAEQGDDSVSYILLQNLFESKLSTIEYYIFVLSYEVFCHIKLLRRVFLFFNINPTGSDRTKTEDFKNLF